MHCGSSAGRTAGSGPVTGRRADAALARHEQVDVLVVGARCAGAILGLLLARQGLDVLVVDKSRFPSDRLSTHMFELSGASVLQRCGILDAVLATGAPAHQAYCMTIDGAELSSDLVRAEDDPLGGYSVRRHQLDEKLVAGAREAGARIIEACHFEDVILRNGRVVGARLTQQSTPTVTEVSARLVVGADGVRSTVARAVGAREYYRTENQRGMVWAYYQDYRPEHPARLHFHRNRDRMVFAWPSDSGLLTVIAAPPVAEVSALRRNEAAFAEYISASPEITSMIQGADRLGAPRSATRYPGYFRAASGKGWVLLGDAGHFKDPILGQGISDAFRQAEELAQRIAMSGLSPRPLDTALRAWWRWRDADAMQMYWAAYLQGRAGTLPLFEQRVVGLLARDPALRARVTGLVLAHRAAPSSLLSWPLLAGAVGAAASPAGLLSAAASVRSLLRPVATCLIAQARVGRAGSGRGAVRTQRNGTRS
ncbi:NAD(P)/FAD-dependent oxidoreductase [Nocardia sp. NPDC058658]|uniref:NAD(P)/FAD-dependent oxidoreductase n=1 Tax=Nocardia sp. NPDC058658 TaxID=3346580 RepID=UPI00364B90F2